LAGHPGYYDYFRVGQTLTTSWVTYNNNEIGEFWCSKTRRCEYRKLCGISSRVQKYVNIMFYQLFRTVGPTYLRDLIFYTNDTDTSNLAESYDGYQYKKLNY
jgi:hypothetical protein